MKQSDSETRWVRLPANVLQLLPQSLARTLSSADSVMLLRQLGSATAEEFVGVLNQRQDAAGGIGDQPADRFWEQLSETFDELGWGRLRHQALHAGVGSLDSDTWAECADADTGAIAQPGCHISTGVLAEVLTRIAGRDVAVMEVECRSRGNDRCRFLFGGTDALGQVYQALRSGFPYTDAVAQLG